MQISLICLIKFMNDDTYLHSELSGIILKAYYKVYNTLGYGFLEKVYENALCVELKKLGLKILQQQPISVFYDDENVGEYFADIVVNDAIILELKAAEKLAREHECQLINYLRATKMEVGLLLNFGTIPQHKRKVFTNDKKAHHIEPRLPDQPDHHNDKNQ